MRTPITDQSYLIGWHYRSIHLCDCDWVNINQLSASQLLHHLVKNNDGKQKKMIFFHMCDKNDPKIYKLTIIHSLCICQHTWDNVFICCGKRCRGSWMRAKRGLPPPGSGYGSIENRSHRFKEFATVISRIPGRQSNKAGKQGCCLKYRETDL